MLEDNSPMPFGKYKGEIMEDVPASYLLWLSDQFASQNTLNYNQKAVQEYIKDNLNILNKEVNE